MSILSQNKKKNGDAGQVVVDGPVELTESERSGPTMTIFNQYLNRYVESKEEEFTL